MIALQYPQTCLAWSGLVLPVLHANKQGGRLRALPAGAEAGGDIGSGIRLPQQGALRQTRLFYVRFSFVPVFVMFCTREPGVGSVRFVYALVRIASHHITPHRIAPHHIT